MTQQNELILVTGGTGKTGRRVVEALRAQGAVVRVGSRSADPAFDWEDRTTWAGALVGAKIVYVAFQPDIAVPGALETVTAFYAQAVAAGVTRMVLLSGRGEIEAEQAEEALKASGVAEWTILRASWFMQNFSESVFLEPVLEGVLALPAGDTPEPFIDVDDIAEVAVAALTDARHAGKLYELTGPEALSFRQAVAEIAKVSGRPVEFISISPEDYRHAAIEAGAPTEVVELVIYLMTHVLDGRNTPLKHGVREALGREPRSFADYAGRTAAAWTA